MKMKGIVGVVLCAAAFSGPAAFGQGYELSFSTFFGGSGGDAIRDVEADAEGNIYVAGTTRSGDFPTTAGAFDEKLETSGGKPVGV